MELFASPLGLLIGLALGAGGSTLTVPLLVHVAGLEAKEAVTASLVVVGSIALGGMVTHWRAGRVRVPAGLTLGASGIAGSVGGSQLNRAVDPDVLLLSFSFLMVVAAWAMVRRRSLPQNVDGTTADPLPTKLGTGLRFGFAGSGIGFVTGFFGIGGGFIIVPVLAILFRLEMSEAVGTSLLVVAINSGVAILSRIGGASFVWTAILPFTLAGLVGVVVGGRIAGRLRSETLARAFVVVIVGLAAYTAATSIANL